MATSTYTLMGSEFPPPPRTLPYRAIATRYEKHATNYLALVKLAAIRIWLRHNESVS
jgi:transposase